MCFVIQDLCSDKNVEKTSCWLNAAHSELEINQSYIALVEGSFLVKSDFHTCRLKQSYQCIDIVVAIELQLP